MSRFPHPVSGVELLASPEMQLRHPAEKPETQRVSSYDEGTGCGFDAMSPDAYAERWVEVAEGAEAVLRWFVQHLGELGWKPAGRIPASGEAWLTFVRDGDDERMGVLLQGLGEWWKDAERRVNWTGGVNSLRVHIAVNGVFPDGSTGVRIG